MTVINSGEISKRVIVNMINGENEIASSISEIEYLFSWFAENSSSVDRIVIKGRSDLFAFNLLGSLVEGSGCIIAAAEHDIIYLNIQVNQLVGKITKYQIGQLKECGIRVGSDGVLEMFV